jgi:hypothetical protein
MHRDASELNLPAMHAAQEIEPASLDVPALHARQALEFVAAATLLNLPTAHSMQAEVEFEPACGLYFPAVQLSQELAPPPATRTLPVRMSLVESQNVKR